MRARSRAHTPGATGGQFVSQGLSNKEVGAQLFLSPRTIEYHLRNVFMKLGISSRAELIRLGVGDRGVSPARH
jgi:DNA-binding NarL/FixJ family response regulator